MALNRYLACFETAKAKYIAQADRPGYPKGWFTWIRHSKAKNPAIQLLEQILQTATESESITLIKNHFATYPSFNNHSFNTYLLDELLKTFPDADADADWQTYQPKPIVLYRGTLFRGTYLPPEHVFKHGFTEMARSASLDDYVSDCNGSVGVSTSKNVKVALGYALPACSARQLESGAYPPASIGYVYEIHYRGNKGIDLEKTHQARGNTTRAGLAANKQEVNVIGSIPAADIVKVSIYRRGFFARQLQREVTNPHYTEETSASDTMTHPRLIDSVGNNSVF